MDQWHREKRNLVIEHAAAAGKTVEHGVAAKLINIYLKSGFVCGGLELHPSVQKLHPPIDGKLLRALAIEFNALSPIWCKEKWTQLKSDDYEAIIKNISAVLEPDQPLWEIEYFWDPCA